jgi:DNA-binding NarL/FixJ family response regulator
MTVGGDDRAVTVLVVDDEADLRTLVRLILEFEDGVTGVATASGADEALRLAAECEPDVVVLDQMLGDRVTGLQVAAEFRAAHPNARLIIFSATDVVDLRAGRVDAFLPKMDIDELPATIRRVLTA